MTEDNPWLEPEGRRLAVEMALDELADSSGIARVTPQRIREAIAESTCDVPLDAVFEGLLALHVAGVVASIPHSEGGGYRLLQHTPALPAAPKELVKMAARKKKGREQRAATVDDGSGLVRVKLTDEQWRGRCDDLASALKKKEDIEGRKAAGNKKWNAELRQLEEQITVLADEVDTREANVSAQGNMFDDKGKPVEPAEPAAEPENDALAEGA